jgi:FeS assembly SUF system protein
MEPEVTTEELEQRIIEGLKTVYDPEIPVNIYDLGLIYEIQVYPDHTVYVKMTLTSPACPVAGILPQQVENKVRVTRGVKDARVELTFDPPYHRDMMSDEARYELGFF